MRGFVVGTIVTAIAFFILTKFLPQFVSYDGDLIGLLVISVVFGVVNGLIGPIVRLMALPIRMATLGLVGFLINAGLLLLTAWITSLMNFDLKVGDFPPTLLSIPRSVALDRRRCRGSIARMKGSGESGSPCRKPQPCRIGSDGIPFSSNNLCV